MHLMRGTPAAVGATGCGVTAAVTSCIPASPSVDRTPTSTPHTSPSAASRCANVSNDSRAAWHRRTLMVCARLGRESAPSHWPGHDRGHRGAAVFAHSACLFFVFPTVSVVVVGAIFAFRLQFAAAPTCPANDSGYSASSGAWRSRRHAVCSRRLAETAVGGTRATLVCCQVTHHGIRSGSAGVVAEAHGACLVLPGQNQRISPGSSAWSGHLRSCIVPWQAGMCVDRWVLCST